jgi:hypothetical protein
MLKALKGRGLENIDLGETGKSQDGVDGVFGEKTEAAVEEFQRLSKDWNGVPLNVDGIVGPRTADALNRAMVGLWYPEYKIKIEKKITKEKEMLCLTETKKDLKDGVTVDPSDKSLVKIIMVEPLALKIRLFDPSGKIIPDASYRLVVGEEEIEGTAKDGWVENEIYLITTPDQCYVEWDKDKNGEYRYSLDVYLKFKKINDDEALLRRLKNLGYIPNPKLTNISDIFDDFKLRFRLRKDVRQEDIIHLHDKGLKDIHKKNQEKDELLANLLETEQSGSGSKEMIA